VEGGRPRPRLIILILLKGPSYMLNNRERVNSLIKKERLCPRLIMLTLLKGPSYILGGGEKVDNFIKGGRLR
jgi:hypothetical protein